MAFVPVPEGIMAEMRYTLLGQQCENVLWFRDETANPSKVAVLQQVGTLLFNWWAQNIRSLQTPDCTLREIYVTDQSDENGPTFTFNAGLPLAGTVAQPTLPNNATLCVSLRTPLRGRSFRGRYYFVGLNEASVTGNDVGSTFITALLADFAELIASAAAQETPLCVATRRADGANRPLGLLTAVQTASVRDTVVDSQRRRLPGRGK